MTDAGKKICNGCKKEFQHKTSGEDETEGVTFKLIRLEFTVYSMLKNNPKSQTSFVEQRHDDHDFCSKKCFKKFMMKYIDELTEDHILEELREKAK